MKKLVLLCACLSLSITAQKASAYTGSTWDPFGTSQTPAPTSATTGGFTGNLSGTWETASWSTSTTEAAQATPQAFVENEAACFAVNANGNTPAFTITMNSNHTVAGVFDGPLNPDPCTVTIQGPGIMTIGGTGGALFANLQGLAVTSDTGDPGNLILDVTIAGALATSGGFTLEDNGNVYLNGTNTYNSGTCVGFSGSAFTGICYITNADPTQPGICTSFGSNTIGISNCLGGAIVAQGTSALTVTNAVIVYNRGVQTINLSAGTASSLIFSGPFSLGTNTLIIGAGQAGNTTIISSSITGSGGIVRGQGNPGTLELNASNAFTGAITCSNGVLALGPLGSVSNSTTLNIRAGGTFDVSALPSPFYLNTNMTLNASGSNTGPATIVGAASGVVNLGAQPINLFYDGSDAALTISQGALTLNGNQITLSPDYPLTTGTYTLISVTGGTINGTPNPNVNVTGFGLSPGCLATLQVSGGNVNLVVTQGNNDYWNGNDFANSPDWSDANNWNGSIAPAAYADSVFFQGSVGLTPVMDSSYTLNSLMFNPGSSSFTLLATNNSVLSVSYGVTNASTVLQTLNLPVQLVDDGQPGATVWDITAGPILMSGVLSDTGRGLSTTGGTSLALSNLNTYTGGTTIGAGGTVYANTISDANCSIGPSGAVTIGSNASLIYTGTAGSITTSRTITFSGGPANLSFSGQTVTLNGSIKSASAGIGNLTGTGTVILGGALDNSSLGMNVDVGSTLILDKNPSSSSAHALGGSTTTVSGTLQVQGPGNQQLYSGCVLFENSGGVIDFDGQNANFSTMTLQGTGIANSGALINSAAGTTSFITNGGSAIVLTNATTIGGPTSLGNLYLASKINYSFPLTYAGAGLLMLAGPSTNTAGLTINNGCSVMLTSGGYTSGGAGTGTVTINGNGTLILSNNAALANTSVVGGATSTMDILLANGNLYLTNSLASFTGTYNVSNQLGLVSAQLVVGNTAAHSPNISASSIINIYPGAVVDFNGGQNNVAQVNLYGLPYTGAANGALRLDYSTQAAPVVLYGNSSIGGAGATSNSVVSGVISQSGGSYGITTTGACKLSLTAANTYSGATIVNSGTLALTGTGSINNSSQLSIAAAAVFDVSGLASTTYNLSPSTALVAKGTGTATTNAATINGASGGTVNLGSQPMTLVFTPTSFTGDSAHPSLYVAQGSLALSGNVVTVSNASATPLGIGTYTLIQVAGGTITGAPATAVTVTGTGLAAGTTATLSVSGATVVMNVVQASYNKPTITGVKVSGTTLTITATNGNANGQFVLLESTNLTTPVTNWIPVLTNSFDGTGSINLSTNVVNPAIPAQFYILQNP